MRENNNLIWILPVLMLLVALLHLPYGYYTLLRMVVAICGGYLAYLEYVRNNSISLLVVLFSLVVIIFNPLIPIYFSKSIWIVIDSLTAFIFGFHGFIYRASHNQSN